MLTSARERSVDAARERLADAARERSPEPRASAVAARLVPVVVAARPLPAGLVMLAVDRAPSLAWVPPLSDDDPWSFVGWGVAARADGAGEDRLAQVRANAARLLDRIDPAPALPFAPRLFGGFAFDAASSSPRAPGPVSAAWSSFGDASFVLPHILYANSGDRALLVAFVPEPEVPAATAALDELRRALDTAPPSEAAPEAANSPRAPAHDRSASAHNHAAPAPDDAPRRAFLDLVARAVAAIEQGSFAKVVLARTRLLPFAAAPDLRRAFTFLEPRHPACARFLLARETGTFLGATPERLLSVRGRRALTEALAGSIPRRSAGDDLPARAALLASDKDRAEHTFVIAAIRDALAPFCEALAIPDEPIVRSLAHVHHLATPITATLRERAHLLDLAARLHPTPALCGSPRREALAFLLAGEPEPRGWYGGAVGWLDERGDGTLAVAIRSALVTVTQAWIYAGAGIVRDSDPALEYTETAAKERAMREALEAAT